MDVYSIVPFRMLGPGVAGLAQSDEKSCPDDRPSEVAVDRVAKVKSRPNLMRILRWIALFIVLRWAMTIYMLTIYIDLPQHLSQLAQWYGTNGKAASLRIAVIILIVVSAAACEGITELLRRWERKEQTE